MKWNFIGQVLKRLFKYPNIKVDSKYVWYQETTNIWFNDYITIYIQHNGKQKNINVIQKFHEFKNHIIVELSLNKVIYYSDQ